MEDSDKESLETLKQRVAALEAKFAAAAALRDRTAEQVRRLDALLAYFERKRREQEGGTCERDRELYKRTSHYARYLSP